MTHLYAISKQNNQEKKASPNGLWTPGNLIKEDDWMVEFQSRRKAKPEYNVIST